MTIKKYIDSCPNHFNGRKSNIPDVIVLHNTGGSNISSAHWWFLDKTSQTSAHFLVGLDGEIRQYVNLADGELLCGRRAHGGGHRRKAGAWRAEPEHPEEGREEAS